MVAMPPHTRNDGVEPEFAPGLCDAIYLAKVKALTDRQLEELDDPGPLTPVAAMTHFRFLGGRREFWELINDNRMLLGEVKYKRLMEFVRLDVSAGTTSDEPFV